MRTRDENVIVQADIVLDVGAIYDEAKHRFDHHQIGGAGERKNKVPYASFGLLWRKYGRALAGSAEAAVHIDRTLVQNIDGLDNGINLITSTVDGVVPYTVSSVVAAFNPTWKEGAQKQDEYFMKAVALAKAILSREITHAKDYVEGGLTVIKTYQAAEDKRLIILDRRYEFQEFLTAFPEPLYAIYPDKGSESWHVGTVRVKPAEFTNRKDFPKAWAGKCDTDLQEITKVSDAIFCHNKLFLAVAKSKEGAIQLARLALDS